ncbi:RNA ligase RtcB family protein [Aliiroseovarius sp.]|uniref:RNA ligase RtcB family protein n=1 Tax=Aliiroseovarius sp. TaxID=1872442 RepID=UPI003BA86363
MGNTPMGHKPARYDDGAGVIRHFFTSDAWIDTRAEDQLKHVAALDGVRAMAAFPDLHPGRHGPVGCTILADRVHPLLAGGDIGCGMALFQLDLPARKVKPDKAAERLRALGAPPEDGAEALEAAGLPTDLFADALGTVGGGNHFCELQKMTETTRPDLDASCAYLLVHSGSRGLGHEILTAWQTGTLDEPAYLARHDQAVTWARLNRQRIAERAARALRADLELVVDSPHNLITPHAGGWLHRKGAAQAGGLVPLAGTRATASYLMDASKAPDEALASTAHGAGRRFDRRAMHGRVGGSRSALDALRRTDLGGRVICDDKALLIEEAPKAYKSAAKVVADLEATGVATPVATLHPVVTYKRAQEGRR